MKVSHFGGKRGLSLNLNKVYRHPSRGFKDSNILKSLHNFSRTMFYARIFRVKT